MKYCKIIKHLNGGTGKMAARSGPRISKDKMILCLDAANIKSFDIDDVENKAAPIIWNYANTGSSSNEPGYCMHGGDGRIVWLDRHANDLSSWISAGYASTNGLSWGAVNNATSAPVQNGHWTNMFYSSTVDRWVAVSEDGDVMYSDDGLSWTSATAPYANEWEGVTYGDGKWVAVSSDGVYRVMYDSNGSGTWTSASAAEANSWSSVAYGDGRFVAVAWNGTNRLMHSTNGSSWSTSDVSGWDNTRAWWKVRYLNGKFFAISPTSGNSSILYSTDGLSWSNSGVTGVNNCNYRDIAYGNGYYVAVSDFSGGEGDNRIMYSKDGLAWTPVAIPNYSNTNKYSYAIAYNSDTKVFASGFAVDSSNVTNQRIVYCSTEGITYPLWKDMSNNNNNGTVGVATNVNVKFTTDNAGAIIFDGTDDKISLASSSDLTFGTGDFTIEFWANPDDFGSRGTFYDSRPSGGTTGITIGHESSSGEIRVYMIATSGSDIVVQSSDFVVGQWQYIVVTRRSGTVRLFINGILKDSETRTSDLDNTNVVNIGYKTFTSSTYDYFDGDIANVRIYKGKGLTSTEVKRNFNTHKSRFGL